jgi:hypothetical protein
MTMELLEFVSGYTCSHCERRIKKGEDTYQSDHGRNRGMFSLHASCIEELSQHYRRHTAG